MRACEVTMNEKVVVLAVFSLVYLYLTIFKQYRAIALWCGIFILVALGISPAVHTVTKINWNIIGIFAGTLILAEFFAYSRVPEYLSNVIIGSSGSSGAAMLRVCVMSGFLSVFIENVAVVLIVAPIALEIIKKLNISPVPMIIGIAISSNLQGTATLIGDPPSMILAGQLKMNFNDFFIFHGNPGIFFAVETGAIASFVVLYFLFIGYKEAIQKFTRKQVTSWSPTILLCMMVAGLALAPLIDPDFLWLSGTICMICAAISIVWGVGFNKKEAIAILKKYDWDTTLFLAGIFVLVNAFVESGLIIDMKNVFMNYLGKDILMNFVLIVVFSVIVSAFIDNVPFITVMIPVTFQMGTVIGSEYLLVFGLLIGTCMGGNITPVGAAANIVSVGILKKEGHPVSFWTFAKIGLPFTVAATCSGALFIWLVWK